METKDNKPERTAMQEALIRAKGMHEVYVDYSKQPENKPGTSNFDVCQAEKEVSRMYVAMIEQVAKESLEMNDAILFSYWLMEHCELEESNSLWSYDGEDYTNERLYEKYLNQKLNSNGK